MSCELRFIKRHASIRMNGSNLKRRIVATWTGTWALQHQEAQAQQCDLRTCLLHDEAGAAVVLPWGAVPCLQRIQQLGHRPQHRHLLQGHLQGYTTVVVRQQPMVGFITHIAQGQLHAVQHNMMQCCGADFQQRSCVHFVCAC